MKKTIKLWSVLILEFYNIFVISYPGSDVKFLNVDNPPSSSSGNAIKGHTLVTYLHIY